MEEIKKLEHETNEDFIYRLCKLKDSGVYSLTWDEIAAIANKVLDINHGESYYRKFYYKLRSEKTAQIDFEGNQVLEGYLTAIEKEKLKLRDERLTYRKLVRDESRKDSLRDLLAQTIISVEPMPTEAISIKNTNKAVYAMLSDLHYGLSFNSAFGKYNTEIAKQRIMEYADEIIRIAYANNCDICYVSLMGDLISGNIHSTIRVENQVNIIEQIVGVSELVSAFLGKLAYNINHIYVNSVPGNHSRLDKNAEETLRGERLDDLAFWYAKTKLAKFGNITFVENVVDPTIGTFEIYGKVYASVHGDLDPDVAKTSFKISSYLNKKIYCLMLGHLHVPEYRFDEFQYVRNGSVCGSGDEYSAKKRLLAGPAQVCCVVDEYGISSIHVVRLAKE